jgi:hypothetical protein
MQFLEPQPSSISKIFLTSIKLYIYSIPKLLGLVLILALLGIAMQLLVNPHWPATAETESFELNNNLFYIPLIYILYLAIYTQIIYIIKNTENQRKHIFIESLAVGFKKLPTILLLITWCTILISLVYLLWIPTCLLISAVLNFSLVSHTTSIDGMFQNADILEQTNQLFILAIMVPSLFFGLLWSMSFNFIMLDSLGSYAALKASQSLVWAFYWRTFFILFLPIIAWTITTSFVFAEASHSIYMQLAHITVNAFMTPYFVVLTYVQFHDLKLRKLKNATRSANPKPTQ